MLLIGLPALMIALGVAARFWRESGQDRAVDPASQGGVA